MSHHHHHQAVDNLINVFGRASRDLNAVHFKLDKEFQQIYPENANPMKLIQRIKKLQEDVTVLKDQCLELLSAKQDLIDKAQTTLVGNYNLIQKMNVSLGEPTNGDADDALADFNQIIDEWTMQVRSRTVGETEEPDKEDINKLLFSAIVHNN
ncbi:Protein FAM33A [Hirschfeldia incana]|nr:Protein FAM33A [Hirschfeldia incana]